ncbi:MAG TPA: patatin-like phospholipase family protein [Bacillota bacterium]|nr:patatin-like phospholipase family protein [Bacillota bacterium]
MLDSIARVLADDRYLKEPRERIEKAKKGLDRKTVGLALGSGAARGLAHIGVIKVFEDSGIPIDAIVGCSAGAMVGGAYACGMSTRELIEKAVSIRQPDIIRYLDLGITSRSGLLRGNRVNKLLMELTNNATFAATRIPFVAIATNVKTGEEVAFDSGPVWRAIRASISIPGIFVPQKIDDDYYVDGAVCNPVPSDYLTAMGLDIVIGVDIVPDVAKSGIKGAPNLITVLLNSFDIFQERLVKMVVHHMDVKIRPAIEGVLAHEFYRAEEVIDMGKRAAMEALDEISALMEQ